MNQDDTYIPRRLNDTWKLGFVDVDVALPFVVIFGIGLLADGFALGWHSFMAAVLGVAASRWFSRQRADKHPAFLLHLGYWYLPAILTPLKRTPPSHIRRTIG